MMDRIPDMTGMEKAGAIERCKARLRSATGTKRSFKMEIRLIQDMQVRKEYEARLHRLDQQLKTLQQDCKALETENARGELFVQADGEGGESNEQDGARQGDNMLKEASAIQDKTQDSLANTKNMIAASKEVGVATLEELERQRDVIQNIERETDRIDDNLARAEALLKQFGKRMATDQFIQCFALINCLLLVAVVLYAIVKKGGLTPEEEAPESPTRMFLRRE
jgi:SNARE protein